MFHRKAPPLLFPIVHPRGYIYFQNRYCERSCLRLNSKHWCVSANLYEGTLRLTTKLERLVAALGSVPSYESERMRSMSKRRQLVLDFIRAYIRLHGVSPSYEVIAKGIGLKSKSNIHRIVHRLKTDGHLVTKPYKFHAIKLVDSSVRAVASL
jgi:hypothetical protein